MLYNNIKTASTFAAFSHDFDTYFVNWQLARRSNLLNGADTYYALLMPSLIFVVVVHFVALEIGLEFFINN
uniref:Uncharacterized protein n=1 Tax=Globodera rostochiensis TaxID=31243 RepID=A0A914H0E9_GLORO